MSVVADERTPPPRKPQTLDATIPLSESDVAQLKVSSSSAGKAKKKKKVARGDASVWAGRVLVSDEFAPGAQPRRRLRGVLLFLLLLSVAGAAGLYQFTTWWQTGTLAVAGEEPAAVQATAVETAAAKPVVAEAEAKGKAVPAEPKAVPATPPATELASSAARPPAANKPVLTRNTTRQSAKKRRALAKKKAAAKKKSAKKKKKPTRVSQRRRASR